MPDLVFHYLVFHYTGKAGYDAIRSQPNWRFLATRPTSPNNPVGAYFTTIPPTPSNLRRLCGQIRISRPKRDYVFCFRRDDGLRPLANSRGDFILFSPIDYVVGPERQVFSGPTDQFPMDPLD